MVRKNTTPGTIETDRLESEHRPTFYMGEPNVFARNLRLLTAMRGLTAEAACKGIAEMLRRDADAERDQVWDRTKDPVARQAASKKAQQTRKITIDPKWYRRLTAKGVSRSDKRTRTQFLAIAKFFGVRHEGRSSSPTFRPRCCHPRTDLPFTVRNSPICWNMVAGGTIT